MTTCNITAHPPRLPLHHNSRLWAWRPLLWHGLPYKISTQTVVTRWFGNDVNLKCPVDAHRRPESSYYMLRLLARLITRLLVTKQASIFHNSNTAAPGVQGKNHNSPTQSVCFTDNPTLTTREFEPVEILFRKSIPSGHDCRDIWLVHQTIHTYSLKYYLLQPYIDRLVITFFGILYWS